MTLNGLYSIRDTVWFMHSNKVVHGTIEQVILTSTLENGKDYKFNKYIVNLNYKPMDNYIEESLLFKSKVDLLKNL